MENGYDNKNARIILRQGECESDPGWLTSPVT